MIIQIHSLEHPYPSPLTSDNNIHPVVSVQHHKRRESKREINRNPLSSINRRRVRAMKWKQHKSYGAVNNTSSKKNTRCSNVKKVRSIPYRYPHPHPHHSPLPVQHPPLPGHPPPPRPTLPRPRRRRHQWRHRRTRGGHRRAPSVRDDV